VVRGQWTTEYDGKRPVMVYGSRRDLQSMQADVTCFPCSSNEINSLKFFAAFVHVRLCVSMVSFKQCIDAFSFVFFLTSPLTSYGDQILAMRRRKSSHGFSIDVCGIMLVARYTP